MRLVRHPARAALRRPQPWWPRLAGLFVVAFGAAMLGAWA